MNRNCPLVHRPPRHRGMAALLALLVGGAAVGWINAQEPAVREDTAKAAFTYNFAKLVEWPAGTFSNRTAPIVIGVLGRDPLGKALDDTVKGKIIDNRSVTVVRFARVEDVRDCHVLFIAASERGRLEPDLAALRGRAILTVSDLDEFAAKGGMVGMFKQDASIRFEVNTAAAKATNLKLSSKLLQFARKIHTSLP